VKLRDYIKRFSPQERADFAVSVGAVVGHLNNVAYEQRTASAALTKQIAIQTHRQVAEWDLRPGDWWLIWPDLIGTEGAPTAGPIQPRPSEATHAQQ
jgi:hypothetical protein